MWIKFSLALWASTLCLSLQAETYTVSSGARPYTVELTPDKITFTSSVYASELPKKKCNELTFDQTQKSFKEAFAKAMPLPKKPLRYPASVVMTAGKTTKYHLGITKSGRFLQSFPDHFLILEVQVKSACKS